MYQTLGYSTCDWHFMGAGRLRRCSHIVLKKIRFQLDKKGAPERPKEMEWCSRRISWPTMSNAALTSNKARTVTYGWSVAL